MKALAEISNAVFKENIKLEEKRQKTLSDMQKMVIWEETKPSWLSTGLEYTWEFLKGKTTESPKKSFQKARADIIKGRQKETIVETMKKAPWVLLYKDASERREKITQQIDKVIAKYKLTAANKAQVYQMLSEQYPILLNVPQAQLMTEDSMVSWLSAAGIDEEIIAKYGLKDIKKGEAAPELFSKHWGDINTIKTNLDKEIGNIPQLPEVLVTP